MRKIKLTQSKYALVDDEDYEWLNQWKWFYNKSPADKLGYARRTQWDSKCRRNITLRMARIILNAPVHLHVDHINGNSLDNRRHNLRLVTPSQNRSNIKILKTKKSCKYLGVHWHKKNSRWVSKITVNKKTIFLGCFSSAYAAHLAYRRACKKYRGGISLGR